MANFIRDRSEPRRRINRRADGSIQAVVTNNFKTDRQDVNVVAKPKPLRKKREK